MFRQIKIVVLILMILISNISCGQVSNNDFKSDENQEKIGSLNDAIKLIENKREKEGIAILNYLIKNSNDSLSNLFYLKSMAYFKLQDYSNSMQSINNAILNDTLNYRSYAVKGDIFQKKQEFDSSLVYYIKAEKGLFNDKYLLNNIGTLYVKIGKIDLAKNIFKKLYSLDPINVDCLYNLAYVYYKLSDFDNALQTVERAIALKNNDPELYNLKGQILGKKGKIEDAIKSFEKSIELKPENNNAIENLKRIKKTFDK